LRSGYAYFLSALLTTTNNAGFFHTATFSSPSLHGRANSGPTERRRSEGDVAMARKAERR
jgi:hypothetical protein